MRLYLAGAAIGLLSYSAGVAAQTFSDCNPLKKSMFLFLEHAIDLLVLIQSSLPPQASPGTVRYFRLHRRRFGRVQECGRGGI